MTDTARKRKPTTVRKAALGIRRQQAIELRLEGLSYLAIGQKLGTSTTAAYRDVQAALGEVAKQRTADAATVLDLELERLDCLQSGVWSKALAGDCEAVNTCLRVLSLRAKLLGLEAPTRVEVIKREDLKRICAAMGSVVDVALTEIVTDAAMRDVLVARIKIGWLAIPP